MRITWELFLPLELEAALGWNSENVWRTWKVPAAQLAQSSAAHWRSWQTGQRRAGWAGSVTPESSCWYGASPARRLGARADCGSTADPRLHCTLTHTHTNINRVLFFCYSFGVSVRHSNVSTLDSPNVIKTWLMPNEAYVVQISPVHWVKMYVLSKEGAESVLGVSCQEVDMSEVLIFIAPTPAGVVARYRMCCGWNSKDSVGPPYQNRWDISTAVNAAEILWKETD